MTEIRETRVVLDEKLADARALTGDGASTMTTITNSALIVFREGLEAILILAAITASMVGPRARLRGPVQRGALLALPASVLMFVLALLLLDSLSKYGEKLEAVVGIVAIGVLLLVMNWFFHRVYWTEWIKGHRDRGKALTGAAIATGAGAATVAGLYTLGFTSVFREGFETVLFLQALQLSSGTGVVLAGVSLGLVLTGIVGAITFALERKLPYKKMLIVTGVLIALVLVVLVGNTARTMQGVGWLSIHPIDDRTAALDGHLARRLPDRGDAGRTAPRLRLRDRQLLRRRVDAQARAAAGDRRPRGVPRGSRRPGRAERQRRWRRTRVGRGCRRDSAPRAHSPLTRSSSATPAARCCWRRSCWSSRR